MEEVTHTPSALHPALLLGLSSVSWQVSLGQGFLQIRLFDAFSRHSHDHFSIERGQTSLRGAVVAPEQAIEVPIVWDERVFPITVSSLQLREQSEYLIEVEWKGVGESPELLCFPQLNPPVMKVEPTNRKNADFRARLNFRDYVGATALVILVGAQKVFSVELEVRSKKVGYLDDYVILLDQLAERAVGLLLRMGSPVFADFSPQVNRVGAVGFEQFLLIRHILRSEALQEAVEVIRMMPHSTLQSSEKVGRLGQHSPRSAQEVMGGFRRGSPIVSHSGKGLASSVCALPIRFPRKARTLDLETDENRFVLIFFQRIEVLLGQLSLLFSKGRSWSFLADLRSLEEEVGQMKQRMPFSRVAGGQIPTMLRSIPRISMSKRRGYRDILASWDLLSQGLGLVWEELASILSGPLRDLAQLYEMWCFFELWEALSEVAEPDSPSPWSLTKERDRFYTRLLRGENSGCRFLYNDSELILHYQRRFSEGEGSQHSYSVALTPDYTLEIVRPGEQSLFLCFDAKYRPEGALEKMHAYRDALRGAVGCYLFYPGQQSEPTLFHRDPALPLPGVGAFPMRPQYSSRVWLVQFLQLALEQLSKTD